MKKIIYIVSAITLLLYGCKKTEYANNDITGEGLVDFTLLTPVSGTNIVLNAAIPATTVSFTWNVAKPGLYAAPKYTWIAALKTGGDLSKPLFQFEADSAGLATGVTLTYQQIDDALKASNIAQGAMSELQWSALADNGSVVIMAQNIFTINITRFQDGASPFILLAPASSATAVAIDPGSTSQNFVFRWTKSKPAAGGPAITYKVLFNTDSNFAAPLFSFNANASPADTTATISFKAMSDSLNAHGLTDLSLPSNLKWTVVAVSGSWKQQADYINAFSILREVRMYMPGSYQSATGNGTDWTPADAPEMIRDQRPGLANNMYYIYISLPAGAQFKFTQGRTWDINYGGTGGDLVLGSNDNLRVDMAGVYRISINRTTLKYDIGEGRMGFVGGATGAGWTPENVFPNFAMGAPATNLFVGLTDFTIDEWKLIDNDHWNDGSNSVSDTRTYGTPGASGTTLDINDRNFSSPTAAGRYRVIWDGRDVNTTKYEISPATEMRVVGDGIDQEGVNDWDPASSPQMTYNGNGVWSINIALKAGKDVKFLAGNAFGAFDYEDAGSGKIKWEGGDNFKTPAGGGTYQILLNENTQTVTWLAVSLKGQ